MRSGCDDDARELGSVVPSEKRDKNHAKARSPWVRLTPASYSSKFPPRGGATISCGTFLDMGVNRCLTEASQTLFGRSVKAFRCMLS